MVECGKDLLTLLVAEEQQGVEVSSADGCSKDIIQPIQGSQANRRAQVTAAYIKDNQVEEEHEDVEDKGSDALQLANNGLCVLKREGQVLPLLQGNCNSVQLCSSPRKQTCEDNSIQ